MSCHPVWVYPTIDPVCTQKIIDDLHLHPVIAQILVSRGFTKLDEIKRHLYSQLPDLIDPFALGGMEQAVERIAKAIAADEKILVYGDNDVDGMTGTALLVDFLGTVGAQVAFNVPNRVDLSGSIMSAVKASAQQEQARLVITVDCGITGANEIEELVGIDVIITDHHEPTDKLPSCVATLNPKLMGSTYPNRELTGVGVAFKLAHACTMHLVRKKMIASAGVELRDYLDLVAMGTIADMGSLLEENRILVRYGLRQLQQTKRVGLRKLCDVCDINMRDLTALDVASRIAPRLNSLGRIAEPYLGVELLLARDEERAEAVAQKLEEINKERQRIEQVMLADVEEQLAKDPSLLQDKAIIMSSEKWHSGVIPIVSTRLARAHHRPTLMIAIDKGVGKGSGRTIREFSLLPALKKQAHMLLNFGGHDYAAGFSIDAKNIPEFRKRFIAEANGALGDQDIVSKLIIDARIDFEELTFDLMESLGLLAPHGNENYAPILYCDAVQVRAPKIVGNTHLKFYLQQNGRQLEGVGFGMASRREELRGPDLPIRVAFTPQLNSYHNKLSIQLLIRDFKVL